jgi:predicted O-methyltransferase YrrM
MQRAAKDAAKRILWQANDLTSRIGVFVLPNHYYTPIADTRALAKSPRVWAKPVPMYGVEMDVTTQVEWLKAGIAPYEPEFRGNRPYKEGVEKGFGPGYGYVEAQCLYGALRYLKPKRVIEVGSGVSTGCILKASQQNAFMNGVPEAQVTCVEPYPRPVLKTLPVRIVQRQVEELDPATFDELEAGDFLFIDSSHAVRPGGDVLYLYLNVLPRLKPGVVVHIHDIYLPYLYQRDLLTSLFQWTETALLLALLTNNPKMKVLASLSYLHYEAPEALREVFPEYEHQPSGAGLTDPGTPGHFPSSIYLLTA